MILVVGLRLCALMITRLEAILLARVVPLDGDHCFQNSTRNTKLDSRIFMSLK